jgi:hypothetical protein
MSNSLFAPEAFETLNTKHQKMDLLLKRSQNAFFYLKMLSLTNFAVVAIDAWRVSLDVLF